MPFKSEKQRRYLWANEPEIARDWTDTYGSRVHKNEGGIMHQFENYAHDDGDNVSVPRSFQARSHSTPVHLAYITDDEAGILQALKPGTPHEGPMGLPNYNDFDAQGNYRSGAAMSAAESRGPQNERMRADLRAAGISPQEAADIRSGAAQAATMGQPRNLGINFSQPKNLGINFSFPGQNFMRNRNPLRWAGNLIDNPFVSGAWSFLASPFSGMSNLRQGMTQQEWEDARNERIRNKSIQNILGREAPITNMTLKNLERLGYTGEMPGVGSTPQKRAMTQDFEREGDDITYARSHLASLADQMGTQTAKGIPFKHELEARNYSYAPFRPNQGGIHNVSQGNVLSEIEDYMAKVTRPQYNTLNALGYVGNTDESIDNIKKSAPPGTFDSITDDEWKMIFKGEPFKAFS